MIFWSKPMNSDTTCNPMLAASRIQLMTHTIAGLFLVALLTVTARPVIAGDNEITVWKSPTCGCCQGWVDYLEDNGFHVTTHNVDALTEIKRNLGITDPSLHSCHTAKIGDYLVEGHVPVADIRRLMEERPDILGITAPGMPMMSPGMHSIEPQGYDVLQFDEAQNATLFSRY